MKIKKIVSVLLAAVMLLSVVPVFAFAADRVSVTFSVSGSETPVQKHEITVEDGIAEKYGYEVAEADHNNVKVEGVTVFDAIVAAHKALYGDAFTKETAENYLVLDKSFIKKSFGKTNSNTGFIVNGIMPHDGIINPKYGSYTSYSCDTAAIKDGDDICYFYYQDKYWADVYTWFDSDSYFVHAGEEVTVNLSGYTAMYYGVNDWETIVENYAIPLEGVDVYADRNGEKVLLGKTDENGNVTFTVDTSVVIYSGGTAIDAFEEEVPVITAYAKVNVDDVPVAPEPSQNQSRFRNFLEKIVDFFAGIKAFFVRVFNKIFKK